jgi:hypothetical protein
MANNRERDKIEKRFGQERKLGAVSPAEAGTRLSEVAAAERPRKPIDAKALGELTDRMRKQSDPAGDFVRRMRDESRY